jgi:hypothetical protein
MAIALPETSPERYLTGTSALSIPTDEGDVADWHFDAAFLRQGTPFRVAGVNFPSTEKILGQEGSRECSAVLRKRSVLIPEGKQFYAATYAKAILDLVLTMTGEHKQASFLRASDLLPERELNSVLSRLKELKVRISDPVQLSLIDQWIQEQQQSANI